MITLRIALRYLFSRKSHNAVNVISIISMLGVAVATAAIVCVLSVFNGFSDLATGRLSRIDPEIKVEAVNGKSFPRADSLAAIVTSLEEIAVAEPTVEEHALAMYNGLQMAVLLKGVGAHYPEVIDIPGLIIDGEYLSSEPGVPAATLSVGTAVKLQARPEMPELLKLYVPRRQGRINPSNPMAAFRVDSLIVGGVYQVEDNESDAETVVAPLDIVRNLLEYSDEATALELKTVQGVSIDRARRAVVDRLGPQFRVSDRLEQQADSLRMISVEKWITFLMLAFILIIALFNVVSTLSMLIIEKRDNMSTLRALGATSGTVRRIFLWEGWLISIVGGVAGCTLGVILCLAQQYGKFIKLGGDASGLTVTVYPVRLEAADVALTITLVVLLGLILG